MVGLLEFWALLRGDLRVVEWLLVGVVARPAGLQGLCSALRSLPLERSLLLKGEFARLDGGLDESDRLLRLFDATGIRDEDVETSGRSGVLNAGEGWKAEESTPVIVLTLLSAKSL